MRGFTVLELMFTLLLLSTLIAVATPSMLGAYDRQITRSEINSFKRLLKSTRLLSINTSESITLCPILNNECTDDWNLPYAVFIDRNQNLKLDPSDSLHLLFEHPSSGHWITRSNISNGLKFTPNGHAYSSASTMVYCPNSNNLHNAKQLIISFQGRIRTIDYLTINNMPYRSLGDLTCS